MHSPLVSRHANRFDCLRWLAAWLVLAGHSYTLGGVGDDEPLYRFMAPLRLGDVGVAVFFILSGYLVVLSLERSPHVLSFLWRRALRIYPALFVVVVLCVVGLGPWLTRLSAEAYWAAPVTWEYGLNASAYWIRFWLPGVFEANPWPRAVNGSLWSLPYELLCYALLAIAACFPLSLRSKVMALFLFFGGLWVWRIVAALDSPFHRVWGLDAYHARLGTIFFLGAVVGVWRHVFRPRLWHGALALTAALLVEPGPWQGTLFLTALAWMALGLALNALWLPDVPDRIGDWSYGLYLYGFPVQQILAHFHVHQQGVAAFLFWSTLCTLVPAALSWYCVEKPVLSRFRKN